MHDSFNADELNLSRWCLRRRIRAILSQQPETTWQMANAKGKPPHIYTGTEYAIVFYYRYTGHVN